MSAALTVHSILRGALAGLALAVVLHAGAARADDAAPGDGALMEKSNAAFAAGDYGKAIDALEALADRGVLHPGLSYNRGYAYLMRIHANAERPGDLGRAAAAFEETLRLEPNDADADKCLDHVRAEVTRRRARKGGNGIDARPTIDRVIARLLSDRTWAMASVFVSFLLAVGIVLRRFERPAPAASPAGSAAPAHPLHVTGTVLVAVSLVALLALVPIAWHARTLRHTTRAGVVVATEAHLTDDTGRTLGGDPIPEAAAVEVGERRGTIVHVRWGAAEGWLPAGSVRVLP
jgi:tetratricopeptide (TPR) repeat protein